MAYTDIDRSSDYFNTVLYTGTGATQSITGIGFQPDLTWIKGRDTAWNHQLVDSVRGATYWLASELTNAEGQRTNGLESFDNDGFSVGNEIRYNTNNDNYVSWNWLASNTTASNTDGSITSTVSANTTSGFSIVSYTGSGTASNTVGHGLGVTPNAVIIKSRSLGARWVGWQTGLTSQSYNISLNYTNAEGTVTANSDGIVTNIGASTFSFSAGTGGLSNVNNSGATYIAYCFAEKKGFSKFGSYTGNGSTDGTFVYTGFKPAFVILKRTDSSGFQWVLSDGVRDPDNAVEKYVHPSSSDAELSGSRDIDFLSNGFKIRNSNTTWNASGGSYIYMCFAKNPFVTSTSIPCTAR